MKNVIAAIFLLLCSSVAFCQAPAPNPQPQPSDPCAKPAACLSVDAQLKIAKLQREQASIEVQYQRAQGQMNTLQLKFSETQKQIAAAENEAVKALGRDPEKTNVDPETFVVTEKLPEKPAPRKVVADKGAPK